MARGNRTRKQKDPEEKKERLLGAFWSGGGRSGFVGRLTTGLSADMEDVIRAHNLATTWAAVARLEAKRGLW